MRTFTLLALILFAGIAGYYFYLQQQAEPLQAVRLAPAPVEPVDEAVQPDPATLQLREEAARYIEEITTRGDAPVEVDHADDFVRIDDPISLFPTAAFEEKTLSQLQRDIPPNSPLTILRHQEQVEITTPEDLLAEHGGNLHANLRILEGGQVLEVSLETLVEQRRSDAPVSVLRRVEHLEVTTVQELVDNDTIEGDDTLKVISEPYRLQSTTVGELLMGEQGVNRDSVFYVRNVNEEDSRGLWGIVHNGLVKNFASGIAIRRGEQVRKYQIDIPPGADERMADLSSSFLGKMIDRKTRESYVYNYRKGSMGRNPDLIYPGQEIVIVGFTPQELIEIYEHFVTRSGSES